MLELMAFDSEKHARILRLIRERALGWSEAETSEEDAR
jgi:hypothetical protein